MSYAPASPHRATFLFLGLLYGLAQATLIVYENAVIMLVSDTYPEQADATALNAAGLILGSFFLLPFLFAILFRVVLKVPLGAAYLNLAAMAAWLIVACPVLMVLAEAIGLIDWTNGGWGWRPGL